jgi:hypothetical protein
MQVEQLTLLLVTERGEVAALTHPVQVNAPVPELYANGELAEKEDKSPQSPEAATSCCEPLYLAHLEAVWLLSVYVPPEATLKEPVYRVTAASPKPTKTKQSKRMVSQSGVAVLSFLSMFGPFISSPRIER